MPKEKTQFKPGESGNPMGRPKGSKNKINAEVKELIGAFIRRELSDLETLSASLEPREKARLIVGLMPYILPKEKPFEQEYKEPERERINMVIGGIEIDL